MPETTVKIGDVVRYAAFGRSVNALVMALHTGDLSHQGANGEPLLDLLYIDPVRESAISKKQIGWQPQTFVEYSVVHASHQFSDEYKREKGITTAAQLATQRGQGEWSEIYANMIDATFHDEEVRRLREPLETKPKQPVGLTRTEYPGKLSEPWKVGEALRPVVPSEHDEEVRLSTQEDAPVVEQGEQPNRESAPNASVKQEGNPDAENAPNASVHPAPAEDSGHDDESSAQAPAPETQSE